MARNDVRISAGFGIADKASCEGIASVRVTHSEVDSLARGFAASSNRAGLLRCRGQVEAVQVHYLVPGHDEVTQKLLLGVLAGIDLGNGSELRMRAKNEIDGGARPLDAARRAITPFVEVLALGGLSPFRAHVEQVHEE